MAGKPERGKRKTLRDEMVQFRTDIPGGAGLPPQHHRRVDLQIDPRKIHSRLRPLFLVPEIIQVLACQAKQHDQNGGRRESVVRERHRVSF